MIRHFRYKLLELSRIRPHVTKILQNFWLTQVSTGATMCIMITEINNLLEIDKMKHHNWYWWLGLHREKIFCVLSHWPTTPSSPLCGWLPWICRVLKCCHIYWLPVNLCVSYSVGRSKNKSKNKGKVFIHCIKIRYNWAQGPWVCWWEGRGVVLM